MKLSKNLTSEEIEKELDETFKLQEKLLYSSEPLTNEETILLKGFAEDGTPRPELLYGIYLFLGLNDLKTAEEWWEKFIKHANGLILFEASGIFAYLGDEFYEWSMRCLRRSAWRQFPIAKRMLKQMKEHPFKFPEA